jgi:spore coat protein U-like protein
MIPSLRAAALTLAALLTTTALVAPAAAQTTGNMQVTASIPPECTLGTIGTLNFGGWGGEEKDANTTIAFNCDTATNFKIALSAGANAQGFVRFMKHETSPNTTDIINYELYQDSGRTEVWGDLAAPSSFPVRDVLSTELSPITVFGRIPEFTGTLPADGNYADTVLVTLQAN